ncbi:Fasciclin arabinogalactan [Hyphodiscus hymeniophilus]|uniref:Fasciclin arabinogalactan n=1 Tax=Hyphodiscus hymeniophilus TaxID=353542 RepID=A0A9P7AUX3_9HELO|nr:Fasciclin arabinogalactan [Hyphodiscus hymeniophilus]
MYLKKLLPLGFAATASAQNLTDALASQNSSLSTLNSLLSTQPGLVSALAGASNITILAPSNEAFGSFLNSSAGKSDAALPDLVAALLTYHVLNGSYPASAFTNASMFIPTLLTNTSYANVTGGQRVEAMATNNTVVFTSGLLSTSMVTTANINFTGGVIHIVDTVLTIPASDSSTAAAANLTSLAGALSAASLVPTVDSLSDVTIFAPSNEAFQAIGSAVGNLSTEQLTSILTYHVVQDIVGYSTLLSNTSLKTVNGANVTITIEDGDVFVNSAKVITPNVLVNNGVVHVIDGVLNPNATSLAPNPSTTSVAFSGASSISSAPFTSGVAPATTIASSATAGATSSSSSAGAAQAIQTGAVGLGALFGGAALLLI